MKKSIIHLLVTTTMLTIMVLVPTITANADKVEADGESVYEVNTSSLNMRMEPDADAPIIGQLVEGNKLRIFDEQDGWVKTFYDGKPVWVKSKYIEQIEEYEETDQKNEWNEEEEYDSTTGHYSYMETEYSYKYTMNSTPLFIDKPEYEEKYSPRREAQLSESIIVTKELLEDYHIVIDPGHGGMDSGAISNNMLEKHLTYSTAKLVAEQLEEKGATVTLTRDKDEFISLHDRVVASHSNDADAFISFHFDWFEDPEVKGISTYYNSRQQENLELAKSIHASLIHQVKRNDRGIRKADFFVLRNNQKPSILLELGFMTNPDDLETIQTKDFQEKVAEAVKDGVINYFGSK